MRENAFIIIWALGLTVVGTAALVVAATALLWLRHQLGRLRDILQWRRIETETDAESLEIGEAQRLVVSPLFEWRRVNESLISDAGLSYLIEVDDTKILFDLGDRRFGERPSPLWHNLKALGRDPETFPQQLSAVVISHHHREHIGGRWASFWRRPGTELDFSGVPVHVPWKGPKKPQRLADGLVLSRPLPGRMFVMGRSDEQMLIVNLAGKGLVCIVGDAHPQVLPMLTYAEHLTGVKTFAYVGGLHALLDFEVRLPWRWLHARRQPWMPNRPEEIGLIATGLQNMGVEKLFVSGHDSDPVSLAIVGSVYGANLRVLATGDVVEIV